MSSNLVPVWLQEFGATDLARFPVRDGERCNYCIQGRDSLLVKWGRTEHLHQRLSSLRNSSGEPQCVLGVVRGHKDLEKEIKARLDPHNSHGEWFAPKEGLVSYLFDRFGIRFWTKTRSEVIEEHVSLQKECPEVEYDMPLGEGMFGGDIRQMGDMEYITCPYVVSEPGIIQGCGPGYPYYALDNWKHLRLNATTETPASVDTA